MELKPIPWNVPRFVSSQWDDRLDLTVKQLLLHKHKHHNKEKEVDKRWKKKTLKIGTWNVRTLHQKGKLDNAVQEMNRMKISILGLAEMRWKDSGKTKKNGYTIIYSGNENHFNGVGIIIHPKISENLSGFWAIFDRVLLVKLKNLQHDFSLIQVYEVCSKSIQLFCIKHTTQRILQVLFNLLQSIPLGGIHTFPNASATS